MYIRANIIVTGMVQGVGYRYFTAHEAHRLSLAGTVRNHVDGSVHVTVEGEKSLIIELTKRLRIGPTFSDVKAVDVEYAEYKNEYNDFRIIS